MEKSTTDQKTQALPPPTTASQPAVATRDAIHPAFYVAVWIALSSSVILFNKYILSTLKSPFPIFLTALHMSFATAATRILAKTTKMLDSRHENPMDWSQWSKSVLPIGVAFTASLIFSNQAYIYLSVAFIQMLKATTPVVVLFVSWGFGMAAPSTKVFMNVFVIVLGVMIASYGEIHFVAIGVAFQALGIVFEATRLVMVQKLLSSSGHKMDPMVSLYYFAPVCASFLTVIGMVFEGPRLSIEDIQRVGVPFLLFTAAVAFMLNVSVVVLIGRTSSLVLTLSGVLKDILLVAASFLLFGDPITGTQIFGYSIALGGLMWYKMGTKEMEAVLDRAKSLKSKFGRLGRRKATVFLVTFATGIAMLYVYYGGHVETLKSAAMAARQGYGNL